MSMKALEALVPGTQGYAAQAHALLEQYEALPFLEKHQAVLHLLPASPALAFVRAA
jgi:hypothetical protein